ncbi:NUDIX hydrolase [Egibacter rhizosphaerae]|nr:NUDIX hydrolase [Egibacter rhizosphaerae]
MPRYPTKRAVSAGGIVVDPRADGWWVLLIARRNAAGELQWTLPKGGLEPDEDHETAALREVAEETGIECRIEEKLGVIDYWFVWRDDRVRYHKFVHYYRMAAVGGDPSARDDEAEEVRWLPIDDALACMAHPNERDLVRKAVPEHGRADAT